MEGAYLELDVLALFLIELVMKLVMMDWKTKSLNVKNHKNNIYLVIK